MGKKRKILKIIKIRALCELRRVKMKKMAKNKNKNKIKTKTNRIGPQPMTVAQCAEGENGKKGETPAISSQSRLQMVLDVTTWVNKNTQLLSMHSRGVVFSTLP